MLAAPQTIDVEWLHPNTSDACLGSAAARSERSAIHRGAHPLSDAFPNRVVSVMEELTEALRALGADPDCHDACSK
jgi:hypothetical protein